MFLLLLAIGLSAHFKARGQNYNYYPATESEPVVLDHIVKAKESSTYYGYEPESRRRFKVGEAAFSIRLKRSGGYWSLNVYPGFKVTLGIRKTKQRPIAAQTIFYGGQQYEMDMKPSLWEFTGWLDGEMTVEKDTRLVDSRPKVTIPQIHLPPLIKTKPFPKAPPLQKVKPRASRRVVGN